MKKIIISKQAEQDLDSIYRFIAQDYLVYADNVLEDLFTCFENLSKFSEIGTAYRNESEYANVRQYYQGSYRIIYEIFEKRIEIIAIVHSARDFKNK